MKPLVFTYLLTYGSAAVSLFYPYVGLLAYVWLAVATPEFLWPWAVPPGNYSRIVAIAMLVGWSLRGFGSWKLGKSWALVAALVAFTGWASLSAAMSAVPELGWRFVVDLLKIGVPFIAGLTLIDSEAKLRQLGWVLLLSQGYVAYELNMAYLGGFNVLDSIGYRAMDNNGVAITMATGAALAFFLGLAERAWWKRLTAWGCAALMTHVVMFSYSRGGMLALCAAGFFAFLGVARKPWHFAVFLVALAIALRMAGPSVREEFLTVFAKPEQRDASAASRLTMWRACASVMVQNPVTGVGPNHWGFVGARYGLAPGQEAHSTWLQMGAELGVPGMLLLLAFFGICVKRLGGLVLRCTSPADAYWRDAAAGVVTALVAYGVSAQFVTCDGVEFPFYVVLFGAGVLRLQPGLEPVGSSEPLPESSPAPASLESPSAATP